MTTIAAPAWDARFERLLTAVLPGTARDTRLAPGLELKKAGLDSLATVELLVSLEEEYGVELPESALNSATFATPAALWETLTRHGAAPAAHV
ncbi:phosphopantetheine-binding protein [Streptomyces sp. NPDC047028]|uniref:phosphopantetheine-binding protein n=1 Tax=Streptomyces sp. NPDC047028 TaxID=3155793 RepID=UPI003404ADDE